MNTLLLISYSFPPLNNSSSFRYGILTKYFSEFGWNVYVITTKSEGDISLQIPETNIFRCGFHNSLKNKESYQNGKIDKIRKYVRDNRLSRMIKESFKLNSVDGHTFLSINDYCVWKNDVIKDFPVIRKKIGKPDLILSTYGPATAIEIGILASEYFRAHYLIDFRDLGALRKKKRNFLAYYFDKIIEKKKIQESTGIITVSETLREILEIAYHKPTITIYNGWESSNRNTSEYVNIYKREYLHYAGVFYEHQLNAVYRLLRTLNNEYFKGYKFVIRSKGPERILNEILKYSKILNISERVILLGEEKYEIVVEEQERAVTNVVFEEIRRNECYSKGTLTSKFLKLLPMNPPILFIARPDSEAKIVLDKTNKGRLCTTEKEITDYLMTLKLSCLYNPYYDQIAKYSAKSQAKKLCSFLSELKNE